MVAGKTMQFGFNRTHLSHACPLKVVSLAISQDNSPVLIRVTLPWQNSGVVSFPALLFVNAC